MHTDAHRLLNPCNAHRASSTGLSPDTGHRSPVTRALRALWLFLRGATGIVLHQSRVTSHESRSYLDRLEHKYSQPTRCC